MEELLDQIRTWRRHLHAIPEIGFQEYKTSKYLYEELEKMGYQPLKITEPGIAVYVLRIIVVKLAAGHNFPAD